MKQLKLFNFKFNNKSEIGFDPNKILVYVLLKLETLEARFVDIKLGNSGRIGGRINDFLTIADVQLISAIEVSSVEQATLKEQYYKDLWEKTKCPYGTEVFHLSKLIWKTVLTDFNFPDRETYDYWWKLGMRRGFFSTEELDRLIEKIKRQEFEKGLEFAGNHIVDISLGTDKKISVLPGQKLSKENLNDLYKVYLERFIEEKTGFPIKRDKTEPIN